MATSRQLDAQLQQIAWSIASRTGPTVHPAEPWDDYDATVEEQRAGCLALLRVYTHMIKVLQRRTDLAVKKALTLDTTYGDIGAACGVSRQAARQRWERRREQYEFPKVRLTGGPRDGEWERPRPGQDVTVTLWETGPARPSGYATYVPSLEDPSTYIFARSQEYDWNEPATRAPGEKTRVYQLAKELGVESKAVIAKLGEMGEFVRSAAFTVELPTERKLREYFRAIGPETVQRDYPTPDNAAT